MKNLKGKLSGTARILTDAELGQVSGGGPTVITFTEGSTIVVQRRTNSKSCGQQDDCLD